MVKLVVGERETRALESYLDARDRMATSRLTLVEATRAVVIANPASGFEEVSRLLEQFEVVDVDAGVVDQARRLVSPSLRTLDAVHLASALIVGARELIAYDRRLLDAAARVGLETASPGA